jgi:putative ABC transport system permease protein
MTFIQKRNLGFDREQVVVVKTFGALDQKSATLKEALLRNPMVVAASTSSSVPGKPFTNVGFHLEGTTSSHGTNLFAADWDFLNVMRLEMVEGRFFSEEMPSDRNAIILNESKARAIGRDDLLNKQFDIYVGEMEQFHVIGIVEDFHYESFHEPVKPLGIVLIPGAYRWGDAYISVRIRPENVRETMNHIRKTWQEIVPGSPFEYSFLDTIYNDQYKNEERTGRVFAVFTFFALFVACLGLLGLSSFAAEQRTKEIGIRKVLGASVCGVVVLLSREFTRWILIANVIAWPAAYFIMQEWLNGFAYRTNIEISIFILSAILSLGIAALTVIIQAVKAARAIPVDSLRYE